MNEYYFPQARKYQVRMSWKLRTMETVTIAKAMHKPSNKHLRYRIFIQYPGHIGTSLSRGNTVNH